jgi:hypothetical protein
MGRGAVLDAVSHLRASLAQRVLALSLPVMFRVTILALAIAWVSARSAAQPLTVRLDRSAHEMILEMAPITLHGMSEAQPGTVALPVDGWLQGYDCQLVDAAGHPLSHALIHHVNLIAPEKRELFSPIMLRIGAQGGETPPVELPKVLGLRVHRGDTLLVTAMFQNPGTQDITGAHLVITMPYKESHSIVSPVSIFPMYLDVMPPAGAKSYDLVPGHSEKSWEGHPAVSGRILALGAHMHRYGTLLRFEDVTTGKVVWQTKPIVDKTGEPVDMPVKTFWWRLGLPIHADHLYRVTAVYDNPTGRTIPLGAMGALGGVFMPSHAEEWPKIDRSASDYVLDLQDTMSTEDMAGMTMSPLRGASRQR